jgi:hypothetical protein
VVQGGGLGGAVVGVEDHNHPLHPCRQAQNGPPQAEEVPQKGQGPVPEVGPEDGQVQVVAGKPPAHRPRHLLPPVLGELGLDGEEDVLHLPGEAGQGQGAELPQGGHRLLGVGKAQAGKLHGVGGEGVKEVGDQGLPGQAVVPGQDPAAEDPVPAHAPRLSVPVLQVAEGHGKPHPQA